MISASTSDQREMVLRTSISSIAGASPTLPHRLNSMTSLSSHGRVSSTNGIHGGAAS
jgi:hypothetical protein